MSFRRRSKRPWLLALLTALCLLASAALFLRGAREVFGARSTLQYLRGPDAPDVVGALRASGTLRADPHLVDTDAFPPLCRVWHERYQRCGKNSCWANVGSMTSSHGFLERDDGTALGLTSAFSIHPREPSSGVAVPSSRIAAWRDIGERYAIPGLRAMDFDSTAQHRLRERCVPASEKVSVIGCLRNTPGKKSDLVACDGTTSWALLVGDGTPQAAIDEAANDALYWFAGSLGAVFFALLLLNPPPQPLAEALGVRVGVRKRSLVLIVLGALSIPAGGMIVNVCLRATNDTASTFASGRGGYVLASAVAVLLALRFWFARRRARLLRAAMMPVAATPRSLLAETKESTVELAVRAAADVHATLLANGQGVAFKETLVRETYAQGRSTGVRQLLGERVPEKLDVTDESGVGHLDMRNALTDIETVTTTDQLRICQRYPDLAPHPNHRAYSVEERYILPNEQLYVLGEVVTLEMQASDQGYRAVRGSPTLGVQDEPLLVYAGSEAGLLEELLTEGRRLSRIGTLALAALGLLGGITACLAWM